MKQRFQKNFILLYKSFYPKISENSIFKELLDPDLRDQL